GAMKAITCGNCGGVVTDLSSIKEIPGLGSVVRCTFCGALLAPSTDPPFTRATRARDVTILVDRSASMRGSVAQARRAVRALLDALAPGDGVQVIAFDHERVAFDGDGTQLTALAPEVVTRIDAFLADLTARGGSELEAALEHVKRLPVREGRTRAVVLVTDAAIGNEGRLLRRAPEILGVERRLFVLGLGPAVDRRLVDKLARTCGGASDTLLPNEDVEPVLARFARRVRDGGPVLTGVSIAWEGARVTEVYPAVVPDLYGGEPIRLVGRYDEAGRCKLVITAASAEGRPFRQELEIDLPESSDQARGLERLWAKRKVDALLDRASRDPTSAGRVKREVTELALAHALVTPYTSLVAEDSEVVAKSPPRTVHVPSASPEGGADAAGAPQAQAARARSAARPRPEESMEEAESLADDLDLLSEREAPVTGAPPPPAGAPPADLGASPPRSFAAAPAPVMAASPPAFAAPSPMPPARHAAPAVAGPAAPPPPMPSTFAAPRAKAKEGGVLGTLKRVFGVGDAARADEDEATTFGVDAGAPSSTFDEPTPLAPPGYGGSYDPEAGRPQQRKPTVPTFSADPPGSEPYDPRELEWLAKRRRGEIDLVFLVDETGSMGPYIAQVQTRLLELVAALRASPLCRSMRLGLVSYRDHAPQDHTYASKVVPLTDDIDAIERAVRALVASGGGDGPESVTDGLVDIVRLDWRPNAARAVAWFGDAPPHGVSPAGDAWPQGCPCGHHWYTQAESCREMGIAVYAVGCLPNLRHYAGGEDVYRTIASTSRGIYLPLAESALLVPLIAGAAVTELDRQRIDEHVADVVAAHREALGRTDEAERVRWITDVLHTERVRPREMDYQPNRGTAAPLRFRDLRAADVAGSLDRLRAAGRIAL
ncbi:MAG: VWA domain-containing protein, partial [Deltaproteobacteria bacterium]|nr:VWA domain-containing protein [Deltaproteobacteria bacterium]